MKINKEYNLQVINPKLAKEWHPTRNEGLTPKDVAPGFDKKVWWICQKGHEWQSIVYDRNKGHGCSVCYHLSQKNISHATEKYNLRIIDPELAKEWHPSKNGSLTSRDVTPGSGKKIWWKCKKGHEWQSTVLNRNYGNNCPYCRGTFACKDNCLTTINPKLAKEWHSIKNGSLTPENVTPGSEKKVWWISKKKHEWKSSIKSRHRGNGCPYCNNTLVCNDNCLSNTNPNLSKEWHPVKNEGLTPRDVVGGSHKKVWWICRKGHEWLAVIESRNKGARCPYCINQLACEDNCLETVNPVLAKEWNLLKNGKLTPKDVVAKSGRIVWWKCKNGHEWKAEIRSRNRGGSCPYCYKINKSKKSRLINRC